MTVLRSVLQSQELWKLIQCFPGKRSLAALVQWPFYRPSCAGAMWSTGLPGKFCSQGVHSKVLPILLHLLCFFSFKSEPLEQAKAFWNTFHEQFLVTFIWEKLLPSEWDSFHSPVGAHPRLVTHLGYDGGQNITPNLSVPHCPHP